MRNPQRLASIFSSLTLLVAGFSGEASHAADAPEATQKSYYLQCGGSVSNCPYLLNDKRQYCPATLSRKAFTGALVHMNYHDQKMYPTLHCFYAGGTHTPQQLIQAADTTYPGNNWTPVPPPLPM